MHSATPVRRRRKTHFSWRAIVSLAVRNLLRHRGRTVSVLAAIMFGTVGLALSQGFIADVFVQLGEAIVHSQSGHIQLASGGYYTYGTQQPDKYVVSDPEGDKKRILSLPEVEDTMARLSFSGLMSRGRADLAIIGEGIEPGKEEKLSSFLRMAEGRRLKDDDRYAVVIGKGVSDSLQLRTGERVNLLVTTSGGAMNTLDLEVVGVFQTFSKEYDSRAVKLPLSAAQELLGTTSANTLVVSLKNTADTRRVAAVVSERTVWRNQEVRTWEQLNDFYPKTVEMYQKQFGGLRAIIMLMVLLGVVNSVNSSVFERMSEFGTMRALGNRSLDVFRLVMAECALLGLFGALAGVGLALLLAYVISLVGIPMPPPPNADLPYTAYIRLTAGNLVLTALACFAATAAAAIIPAVRVARCPIAEALRQSR